MRKLLPVLLFCLSFSAAAQEWKSPLPIDSATHKITYQGIVQVPGVTRLELYSRALSWFANFFGPSFDSLENSSPSNGSLTANGYTAFDYAFMGKAMPWAMWRRIKVEAKDGRYRYTITDFHLGGPLRTPESVGSSIDDWLAPTIKKGKRPAKLAQSVVDGVERTTTAEISSLQARMSATLKKEKDW
jgi:hypothetical protein